MLHAWPRAACSAPSSVGTEDVTDAVAPSVRTSTTQIALPSAKPSCTAPAPPKPACFLTRHARRTCRLAACLCAACASTAAARFPTCTSGLLPRSARPLHAAATARTAPRARGAMRCFASSTQRTEPARSANGASSDYGVPCETAAARWHRSRSDSSTRDRRWADRSARLHVNMWQWSKPISSTSARRVGLSGLSTLLLMRWPERRLYIAYHFRVNGRVTIIGVAYGTTGTGGVPVPPRPPDAGRGRAGTDSDLRAVTRPCSVEGLIAFLSLRYILIYAR